MAAPSASTAAQCRGVCPASSVHGHVRTLFEQQAGNLGSAGGAMKCRGAARVASVDIRAAVEQQADQIHVPGGGSELERRGAQVQRERLHFGDAGVDPRAALEQAGDGGRVPAQDGLMERQVTQRVDGIEGPIVLDDAGEADVRNGQQFVRLASVAVIGAVVGAQFLRKPEKVLARARTIMLIAIAPEDECRSLADVALHAAAHEGIVVAGVERFVPVIGNKPGEEVGVRADVLGKPPMRAVTHHQG